MEEKPESDLQVKKDPARGSLPSPLPAASHRGELGFRERGRCDRGMERGETSVTAPGSLE